VVASWLLEGGNYLRRVVLFLRGAKDRALNCFRRRLLVLLLQGGQRNFASRMLLCIVDTSAHDRSVLVQILSHLGSYLLESC
jgi:hypothetical protein